MGSSAAAECEDSGRIPQVAYAVAELSQHRPVCACNITESWLLKYCKSTELYARSPTNFYSLRLLVGARTWHCYETQPRSWWVSLARALRMMRFGQHYLAYVLGRAKGVEKLLLDSGLHLVPPRLSSANTIQSQLYFDGLRYLPAGGTSQAQWFLTQSTRQQAPRVRP